MLKYFKKQKCRLNSTNENDHNYNNNTASTRVVTDTVDSTASFGGGGGGTLEEEAAAASKRHSLRSTSSFCDEVFLEELAKVGLLGAAAGGGGSGSEDDAVSYGALSLGAVSCGAASAAYTMAVNSIVGFDEDLFKYHSRLSMTITTIVKEPNCLSYFVQFLEKKNALPLIKFYLDTENFKNAALAQLRKELKSKLATQQILEETDYEPTITVTTTLNDTDDQIQNKQQQQQSEAQTSGTGERHINNVSCGNSGSVIGAVAVGAASNEDDDDDNRNVPELKTLCDLTMRKPLTDDEKSQIYAETNKHIISNRNNERHKLKSSSELSLCSLASNFSEINENAVISIASVKDALAIYKKYLIQNAKQLIELPVEILSNISLIICKKDADEQEGGSTSITADCFLDAQQYVLNRLEKEYLNDFLQSTYYSKYCVELIDGHHVNINDILHSEVTLFYFMEYLEQHQERDCLDFWSTAINYRKTYASSLDCNEKNEKEAQTDAMIIYEKFFSLQSELKLWSSNRLRANVEACICTEGMVRYCFDLPLKVGAKYLEHKYLKSFLKSSLFSNYMNELKSKMQEESERPVCISKYPAKLALRRCVSDKISNRHRKTLSDCTLDKKVTISQHNTLLAAMDNQPHNHPTSTAHLTKFQLNIDSSQLTNPNLLWHRSNSNNLKFGRVNSLGRYERDFVPPSDASTGALKSTNNWSLSLNGTKLKNAMRKLVHLPEDNVQEEIAWQVAEMIVKDVTSVTMAAKPSTNENKDRKQKIYL